MQNQILAFFAVISVAACYANGPEPKKSLDALLAVDLEEEANHELDLAIGLGKCVDVAGFTDKYGTTCQQTKDWGNCKNGKPALYDKATLQADANGQGVSVVEACCVCGGGAKAGGSKKKGTPKPTPPPTHDPQCSGNVEEHHLHGKVTDGSPGSYKADTVCTWLIAPTKVHRSPVTLKFDKFDLEDGFDFLYIYDGDNDKSRLIKKLTGSSLPDPITAEHGHMFIKFKADESANADGFSASFSSEKHKGDIGGHHDEEKKKDEKKDNMEFRDNLSSEPTSAPTSEPSKAPAAAPKAAGCKDSNSNCGFFAKSGYCGSNAWVKSNCKCACNPPSTSAPTTKSPAAATTCKPIVQTMAHSAAINIMMTPSGFKGDMAKFDKDARFMAKYFEAYPLLDAKTIKGLNIFAVHQELDNDTGSNCHYGCQGIDRLLCCDNAKFRALAQDSCGSGYFIQILVIHNDDKYGGAGGSIATASSNPAAPKIAVHELGHSLFGLADEYAYGWGTSAAPNCAAAGCSKWADLQAIKEFNVKCVPACKAGGGYYASGTTTMRKLDTKDFGAVNERVMCCKYLFHGHHPKCCDKFNSHGLNLEKFCRANIWKGQEPVSKELLLQAGSEAHLMARAQDPQGVQQVFVKHPVEWHLERDPKGDYHCIKVAELKMGLYKKGHVGGENHDHPQTGAHTSNSVPNSKSGKVTVAVTHSEFDTDLDGELDTGMKVKREMLFHTRMAVEVPPASHSDGHLGHMKADADVPRDSITVILNQGEGCVVRRVEE